MTKFILALISLFALTSAQADVVDFYSFKTPHSKNAMKTTKFKLIVHRTHLLKPGVDAQKAISCYVIPQNPEEAVCNFGKSNSKVRLKASLEGGLRTLAISEQRMPSEVKSSEKVAPGVFQFMMNDNSIYHIHILIPVVVDDSLSCLFSVVSTKKSVAVQCGSEFSNHSAVVVEDLPALELPYIHSPLHDNLIVGMSQPDFTYSGCGSYRYKKEDCDAAWGKFFSENQEPLAKLNALFVAILKQKKFPVPEGVVPYQVKLSQNNLYLNAVNKSTRALSTIQIVFTKRGVSHLQRGTLRTGD